MKKKAITLENLSTAIETVAKSVDQLGVSMKQGFNGVDQRFIGLEGNLDQLAISVKQGFDAVDERFDQVDAHFEQSDLRLTDLEQGQDQIKLKLDNVAYRFEINALEQRVNRIDSQPAL